MKRILLIITAIAFCFLPTACKTKQLRIEKSEERKKEVRKSEKDSVFEIKKQGKSAVFQLDNSQFFELDLETEKDSTGQSKVLEFERIRSPAGEKIIVRGGRVKIKTSAQTSEKITKKDTLQVNNTSVRTSENTQKITENKSFKKEKEVKTQGFTFGGYLSLIFWILILGTLIFLAWRLKLFRKITAIITKFKRLLKMI
ncbi:hypothetical protein [Capnocytophaga canimorsus]|uniref:hypothetical protein n=1 Tax=Capnocytophaga canimorsus TaxID=28188 RepID=UPI0037D015D5